MGNLVSSSPEIFFCLLREGSLFSAMPWDPSHGRWLSVNSSSLAPILKAAVLPKLLQHESLPWANNLSESAVVWVAHLQGAVLLRIGYSGLEVPHGGSL